MSGQTLKDKIWNENMRNGVGVANIVEKIKENGLRLFGHM